MSSCSWLDFSRYAVWGLGKSGQAAANLLARRDKEVVASDIRPEDALRGELNLDERVVWVGGENTFGNAEVVVTSPGLKPGLELFDEARRREIPVISEVDLAFDASDSRWIGITGTDGKTTTTGLVGEMLLAGGREVVVAGNIGTALCDVVGEVGPGGIVIAEISANQLWSCHHLSVDAAAITNVAEDHVDYFESFDDYTSAKHRLVRLQAPGSTVVLPGFDEPLGEALSDCDREVIYFGASAREVEGCGRAVYFDGDRIGRWKNGDDEDVWFDDWESTGMVGAHNRLNAACAAAIARRMEISWSAIATGLKRYSPEAHRMEPVAEVDGVRYIDDSKATNAHASLAGLKGLDVEELVVIAGGRDKGLDLGEWADEVAQRVATAVVIGEISEKMGRLLEQRGGEVRKASTLEEAVGWAHERAEPGSTVVLSPACSSYDMFSSYKERGRRFKAAVRRLNRRRS